MLLRRIKNQELISKRELRTSTESTLVILVPKLIVSLIIDVKIYFTESLDIKGHFAIGLVVTGDCFVFKSGES